MKQFIYFIASFLITSCASRSSKSVEIESVTEAYDKVEKTTFANLEDSYSLLITEKLQDYLDQQNLAQQHPEFNPKKNIKKLFDPKDVKKVLQIEFIKQPEAISDSIIRIMTKVHFANTRIDTILSFVKTSTTTIDGVTFKTSKVTFKRGTNTNN